MKVINIRRKKFLTAFMVIIFFFGVSIFYTVFGMQHYYKIDFSTGLVTATKLNVRSGPGIQYGVVASVKQGEYIRVFAGVGEWYIVQIEGDYVGAVNKKYIKPIYPNSNNSSGNTNFNNNQISSNINSNEQEVFNLINAKRTANGLQALKFDSELQRVAKIKAQDMVDNNYFSHTSPTYGSPFDMLKSFKISYTAAAENIAGNSSNSGAVEAWMNSSGHKANILNSTYTHTGIGVVKSQKYGKIFVQMFIKK